MRSMAPGRLRGRVWAAGGLLLGRGCGTKMPGSVLREGRRAIRMFLGSVFHGIWGGFDGSTVREGHRSKEAGSVHRWT